MLFEMDGVPPIKVLERAVGVDTSLLDQFLRYVGNKMATFVMQTLGCDVAGINTVHFSTF